MAKKIVYKISFILVFFIVTTRCSPTDVAHIKNLKGITVPSDSIDTFLESRMDSLNIPGLSIAIINDGQVAYHKVFGFADLDKKLPITKETLFEGASMSKSVFACFVMTFVEENKLDLDKPLFEYLPYPDIDHDERYQKITARMVLSHRSGFPNWRENEPDQELKLKFDPGTDYEYSGEGYQYLALVLKHIERTDWKGLEALFQERVARPLGMEHTTFIPTANTMENKAQPYDLNGDWIDWKNDYWYQKEKGKFMAPSSIHSEPIDFSKWMIAVMNNGLLSAESYRELLKHHSTVSTASTGMNIYYTLGFLTADQPYQNTYFHGGNNDGFTCWYLMDVEKDWGYVLFTNSTYGERLGNELWDYLEKDEY